MSMDIVQNVIIAQGGRLRIWLLELSVLWYTKLTVPSSLSNLHRFHLCSFPRDSFIECQYQDQDQTWRLPLDGCRCHVCCPAMQHLNGEVD